MQVDLTKPFVRFYDAGAFVGETEHRFMFSFYRSEHQLGQCELVKASELEQYLRYLHDHTHYQVIALG
jgi:hypothetical protein